MPREKPPFETVEDRDDDDDDQRERRPRRRRFTCPYCGSTEPPMMKQKISTVGWIVFAALFLLLCWPLCWIGFLMKEDYRECFECGVRVGG